MKSISLLLLVLVCSSAVAQSDGRPQPDLHIVLPDLVIRTLPQDAFPEPQLQRPITEGSLATDSDRVLAFQVGLRKLARRNCLSNPLLATRLMRASRSEAMCASLAEQFRTELDLVERQTGSGGWGAIFQFILDNQDQIFALVMKFFSLSTTSDATPNSVMVTASFEMPRAFAACRKVAVRGRVLTVRILNRIRR